MVLGGASKSCSELSRLKIEWNRLLPALVYSTEKYAIYPGVGFSYLRWDPGIAVRCHRIVFPQGVRPTPCVWKHIYPINAEPRRKRDVPWVHETPNVEWPNGHSNFLSGGNGMVDRSAPRW